MSIDTGLPRVEACDLDAWHAWLQDNHARAPGAWLVYWKAHTGHPTLTYGESVEEALCWGWVDNLMRSLDAERYLRRFVPRKPNSKWSASNRERVRKLQAAGRMQPAGLALIEAAKRAGHWRD